MAAHCLVCNFSLEESSDHFNVFNILDCPSNKLADSRTVNNTLFVVLAQILNRPLDSIILHSQVLCRECYSKILAIVDVQAKLQELETALISSFDQTAFAQTELASTNDVLQGLTESLTSQTSDTKTEESPLENLTDIDFGKNTSVVDIDLPIKRENNVSSLQEQVPANDKAPSLGKQYICEKCGKTFSANSHWVDHMLIHIDVKPHTCSFCKKTFRSLSTLKVHERGHTALKPYRCDTCGKSFSERHYLTEHALVHTDRKPFKCSVCEREFARRKDMMAHVKLHSGERPHGCPHCPKKFVVKSRLNRHLKIHSKNRPHQCKICQKSFLRLTDYQIHERLHTGEKPYKCKDCDKSFSSLSNFRAHERRHRSMGEPNGIADPLEMDSKPVLKNEPAVSKNTNSGINVVGSQKMTPGTEGVVFPVGEGQSGEIVKLPQRLPSLVNFHNSSERKKSSESTLPLDADLSNVTLATGESQQPFVLMQFPLLQEPPPLVLYSAPRNSDSRNSDQAIQLANSMLVEPASSNNLSQLQVLRWDNVDDVLFHDNSNGPLLAQTLF